MNVTEIQIHFIKLHIQ